MGAKNVPKTKGKGIYKTIKGERVKLTRTQIRESIMKNRGWNREEYKKQYDIFRNKLRAYENYQAASGKQVQRQSPLEILYYESRQMKRRGADYKPSIEMQEIRSFSSVSSGKAGKKLLTSKRYRSKRDIEYSKKVSKQFKGLIEQNEQARYIAESIKDPVQREKALADYARKLHAKIDAEGKVQAASAIPFGQTIGSPDSIDGFDIDNFINAYL